MSLRAVAFVTSVVMLAVAGFGCGGDADDVALTAEAVVATAIVVPTSTPMPPTATPEPTEVPMADEPEVKVPNRGYNALGDPDAPIKMFDFSDFL